MRPHALRVAVHAGAFVVAVHAGKRGGVISLYASHCQAFLFMHSLMPVAVARSFSGNVVVCYVLPVLRMFSCSCPYGGSTLLLQQRHSLQRPAQ